MSGSGDCPDANLLAAFAGGALAGPARERIADHASWCDECRALIATLIDTDARSESGEAGNERRDALGGDEVRDQRRDRDDALAGASGRRAGNGIDSDRNERDGADGRDRIGVPERIDRYRIEGRLGAGAMGVVYAAFDPELDRKIAIKVLHPGASSPQQIERLRREAQALAKLTHPNVVAVHDVGDFAGGAFVAMARVDGASSREWAKTPRTTEAIVDVIAQACRGVVAAHEAGIVHRDLKPDNILVGARGEALVGDFGLARSEVTSELAPETPAAELTQTGTLLGTPAYMAPEQAVGEATPASDQFSLCVTAWELLYGARPFAGRTVAAIMERVRRGEVTTGASARRVPARIVRALRRGLAADPAERHPSVAALLDAIAPRRRRWAIVAGGAAVAAAAVVAIAVTRRGGSPDACADPGSLATAWSQRRDEVAAALARSPGAGSALAPTALRRLDAYVADWSEVRRQVCVAARDGTRTPERTDPIQKCLDRRATTARKVIDALAEPGGPASNGPTGVSAPSPAGGPASPEPAPHGPVSHALQRLEALAPVDRCRDAGPDPTGAQGVVDAKLAELAQQRAIDVRLIGVDLDALVASARSGGDAHGFAETLTFAGVVYLARWNPRAAEPLLREAIMVADRAREDRQRASAAAVLAEVLATTNRLREAAEQRDVAASALTRAGTDPDGELAVEHATARIAEARRDTAAEIAARRKIVKLATARSGDISLAAAVAWGELAQALQRANDPDFDRASAEARRISAAMVSSPTHSIDQVAKKSIDAMNRGDYGLAIEQAIVQADLGRRTPSGAPGHFVALAQTYEGAGSFGEAHRTYREAVAWIDGLPAAQRDAVVLLDALEGEGRAALELAETSDEGPAAIAALATASLATTDRALALGNADPGTTDALETQRGRALVALRRWDQALPILRAALERAEAEQPQRPFSIAIRCTLLARTLWEVGGDRDRDRARALAAQAEPQFATARAKFAATPSLASFVGLIDRHTAELAAWRKAHP